MSVEQIERYELRNACYHEAAHAVVAEHLGFQAEFFVRRVHDRTEAERSWTGSCTVLGARTPEQGRLIGLAGEVATHLLQDDVIAVNEHDPADVAYMMLDFFEGGYLELSESDKAIAGDFGTADLEACVKLVQELWQLITAEAERMFKFASTTPRDYACYWSCEPESHK